MDPNDSRSLATCLRSLGDRSITYPLSPPLTAGCPETSTDKVQYPLAVTYEYDAVVAICTSSGFKNGEAASSTELRSADRSSVARASTKRTVTP